MYLERKIIRSFVLIRNCNTGRCRSILRYGHPGRLLFQAPGAYFCIPAPVVFSRLYIDRSFHSITGRKSFQFPDLFFSENRYTDFTGIRRFPGFQDKFLFYPFAPFPGPFELRKFPN